MNELKTMLTDYQKMHNILRHTFIQKVGYKNIVKGLPVLDAFIESPNNYDLKVQLWKLLNISGESIDNVVTK